MVVVGRGENAYLEILSKNQVLAFEPMFINFDWQEMWPENLYCSNPPMTWVLFSVQGYLFRATHT